MTQVNLWLAILGGLTLLLGLSAGIIQSRPVPITQPIAAMATGVMVGPVGFNLLQITIGIDALALVEELARLTVAFAVTSIALRLDPTYYRTHVQSLVGILGPGMILMWLFSSLVIFAVLPVNIVVALLIGGVLTPTDPVLANSIVVGGTAREYIPRRLRHLLSGEAGINDGIAYLFVFLPILLIEAPLNRAIYEWASRILLWEVLGAIIFGFAIGAVTGKIEDWISRKNYLEVTSIFTLTVALTVFVLGVTKLVGTNDILAVFVAGAAYNWQANPHDEAREQRVEEVFNRLFTIPVFIVFGMVLPWSDWTDLGWRAGAIIAGLLLFRRFPMILLIRRVVKPLDRPTATLFVGWFGPMGVAAVFYALLARNATGMELVWTIGSLVVAASVLAHGITAVPATRRYGNSNTRNNS